MPISSAFAMPSSAFAMPASRIASLAIPINRAQGFIDEIDTH
jgi:hypothetical protein